MVAAFGEPYHYQGSKQKATPEPFPKIIQEIGKEINGKFPKYDISECTVNSYDGRDAFLPEHADDESAIANDSLIFTVSLGQARTIVFRNMSTNTEVNLCVEHGSLYTMSYASQHIWRHRMDKETNDSSSGKRISITFRCIRRRKKMDVPISSAVGVPPQHIVLGDSLMRYVNTNKDSLTIFKGGAIISDIKPLFENTIRENKFTDEILKNIKSLTLCVGTNNLTDKVPLHKILYEYCELLDYLRHKLPSCRIGLFNIPPRFYHTIDLMIRIKAFNNSLLDLTRFYPVNVLQVFWQLMDSHGYINPSLFKKDALHFSMDGVSLVTSHILNFQKNRERFNY